MKKKELKELIEQGEGYFVEFKEQIGVSLDKEMVAFANASGGKIVIGVADSGKIIGSGINRMRQAMAARNIEVEFDTGDFFIVTLARPETTRKEVTPQAAPQVTPQALSDVELRILQFCNEEKSASEIINFTGMNPDYIRKDLIPKLIEKGLFGFNNTVGIYGPSSVYKFISSRNEY